MSMRKMRIESENREKKGDFAEAGEVEEEEEEW